MKKLHALIYHITLSLVAYCESKGKVFVINGVNDKGGIDAYLIRYLLVNTKYFNFYIHRFLRSDHDVPHDHPWNFMTYIVEGEYNEEKFEDQSGWLNKSGTDFNKVINRRPKGSLVFRKSTDIHRVIVDRPLSLEEKEKATLTLCITGPRHRVWGFWKGDVVDNLHLENATFTKWTEYLGIEDDSAKRG